MVEHEYFEELTADFHGPNKKKDTKKALILGYESQFIYKKT